MSTDAPLTTLKQMLAQAVDIARPENCLPRFLPPPPSKGRTFVIGAGKAAAVMARTLEAHWPGSLTGMVVTRYGYAVDCERIEILQAAHPVPDENSLGAALKIQAFAKQATVDDLVIMLISGGGSSLLCLPAPGLDLEEKQRIHEALLHSGANIREINCVRRHLSAIKGGHLAQACAPAQVYNLIISDVPGDHLIDIASGPTVADPTTCADALQIIDRYNVPISAQVRAHLEQGHYETPKPDAPTFARIKSQLIATAHQSLTVAAEHAQRQGYQTLVLGDAIEGESREVAKVIAGIAQSIVRYQQPLSAPCVLLSGGETTVTVRNSGKGGPNVEFLLGLLIALQGNAQVYGLAADTDGVDGSMDIAGAWFNPQSLQKAWAQGLNPQQFLDAHDAHSFFGLLNQQIITGPTHTNVNDFRALLITPPN